MEFDRSKGWRQTSCFLLSILPLNCNYCNWATWSIVSFSIRIVVHEWNWLRSLQSTKVTRCCQDSLLTVMTDTDTGSMWLSRPVQLLLFSFTVSNDCLASSDQYFDTANNSGDLSLSVHSRRPWLWCTRCGLQRPYRVLCGNVLSIHFTAIWSGWVQSEPEYNRTRADSSVIRYRLSAVRTYGGASAHCQL